MIQFNIQVSFNSDTHERIHFIVDCLQSFEANPLVKEFNDNGRYADIKFLAENAGDFWAKIQNRLLSNLDVKENMIICCQGKEGWDDFLLLHHFDEAEKLDEI